MKALHTILRQQLAPSGVLRAAVNLSNPLLITSTHPQITGPSPSFAFSVAHRLSVPLQLVPYDHPDDICAAAEAAVAKNGGGRPWDIALIAADPDRAAAIDFTPPYCEINATCMVPLSSPVTDFNQLNEEGVRVSTKGGGAYDLWLTRNWREATLVRSRTLDESYLRYVEEGMDALAGLRPRLMDDLEKRGGVGEHRIMGGSFMSVQQAVGCFKVEEGEMSLGHKFLCDFVGEARVPGGIVDGLLKEHGMEGRLSLPSLF